MPSINKQSHLDARLQKGLSTDFIVALIDDIDKKRITVMHGNNLVKDESSDDEKYYAAYFVQQTLLKICQSKNTQEEKNYYLHILNRESKLNYDLIYALLG